MGIKDVAFLNADFFKNGHYALLERSVIQYQ